MLYVLGDTLVLSPDFSASEEQPLTCSEIIYMLENTLQVAQFSNLQETGILTEQLQPYFADGEKVPARAEVIMLMANAYDYQQRNVHQE